MIAGPLLLHGDSLHIVIAHPLVTLPDLLHHVVCQ